MEGSALTLLEVGQLFGTVFGKGVRSNPIFELINCFTVVLLHPLFVMLLGVSCVAFTGVGACVFMHYHSVSTDVTVFAFACFVAMAIAGFIHEFQRLDAMHKKNCLMGLVASLLDW